MYLYEFFYKTIIILQVSTNDIAMQLGKTIQCNALYQPKIIQQFNVDSKTHTAIQNLRCEFTRKWVTKTFLQQNQNVDIVMVKEVGTLELGNKYFVVPVLKHFYLGVS